MKPVVPFVSEESSGERRLWLRALREALEKIAEIKSFEDLSDGERRDAKVAIVANPDPAKIAALPNLIWVQSLWAGVERLTAELPGDGPLIVRMTDPQMAETMSEAVLAWTLYLHRDMPLYHLQQKQKIWKSHTLRTSGQRTVGVLGTGALGSASATRLKTNGFNVLGWSRNKKDLAGISCHHGKSGLLDVLRQSDIVVILVPLTADTRGLLGEAELNACKHGAAIINFARGPILETNSLISALDRNRLGHAVLDVFDEEPLPDTSPLWRHEKITVLPHISAPTIAGTASRIVAGNIGRYFEKGEIPQFVDRCRGY